MADMDALIPLKFPGPVHTAILSMSSISISDSFKNLEIKKKAYHCYFQIFQKIYIYLYFVYPNRGLFFSSIDPVLGYSSN
tara:strand:+ start:842 stop:1081 length:240 start_codon:yes stop_codon:yes gene_type:complete